MKAQVTPVRVIGLPILVLPVLIAPGVKALVVRGLVGVTRSQRLAPVYQKILDVLGATSGAPVVLAVFRNIGASGASDAGPE